MQRIHQAIDDRQGRWVGHRRELRVNRGGERTGVAKHALTMAKTQALFEQVRSEGMAT